MFKVAEVELVYRSIVKPSQRVQIKTSKDAADVLLDSWGMDKMELVEQFKILLLNQANRVLGIFLVSSGGIAGTVADPKLIFIAALKTKASSIILCHNHPSGNLNPSEADKLLTKRLKEGGALLEIKVLDHIILTSEGYLSFADEGLY